MGGRPAVLVVEDELLIGMGIEHVLRGLGCRVLGPVASVAAALALLDATTPEAALLDIHLAPGADSLPVAAALARRGVPFAVLSGAEDLPEALRGRRCLAKPFRDSELAELVGRLLAEHRAEAG